MGVTLNSFLDIIEEMVEGEGALKQPELKQILDKLVNMTDVSLHSQFEHIFLIDLLSICQLHSEKDELFNRHPIILITQNDNGNFVANILADPVMEDNNGNPSSR